MKSSEKHARPGRVFDVLQGNKLFEDISESWLHDFSRHCHFIEFDRNATLFTEGETGQTAYVIVRGTVDAMLSDHDGREVLCQTYSKNDTVGLHDVADARPRSATHVCATRALLVRIPPLESRRLVAAARMQRRLAAMARADLEALRERYRRVALFDLETRLAHYLKDRSDAAPRRQDAVEEIVLNDNQFRIATQVHASRTRVNVTLQKWNRSGAISYRRDRIILNESRSFWRRYHIDDE